MVRALAIVSSVALCAMFVFAPNVARAEDGTDEPVLISGTGAAHGLGMAMDGVLGEARAGWKADRILSLFYSGTVPGRAAGDIRVGLAIGRTQGFGLPGGAVISDVPQGHTPSQGFPVVAPPGARVVITKPATGLNVYVNGKPAITPAPARQEAASNGFADPQQVEDLTPPPGPLPTPSPTPTPTPTPTPAPDARGPTTSRSSIYIVPSGNPAVTQVDATGHAYRGVIEVRRDVPADLRVVNHVNLETYVAGIAEEKGAGWPDEALKVLAIAARSLGASTISWMGNNHPNGYDICPNENCQVYLGYDGEEPAMQRAVTETAGQIRTFNGRPILAMYHGNGGGITESYARLSNLTSDPYPYLRSVKYPFAKPSHWERALTFREIGAALGAAGNNVPLPLVRIEITERGDSPRVVAMRLVSDHDESQDISGQEFARALHLRSTWFDIISEGPDVAKEFERLREHRPERLAMGRTSDASVLPAARSSSMLFAALGLFAFAGLVLAVTARRDRIAAFAKALVPRTSSSQAPSRRRTS